MNKMVVIVGALVVLFAGSWMWFGYSNGTLQIPNPNGDGAVAGPNFLASPASGVVPLSVSFSTQSGPDTESTYSVDFGDGKSSTLKQSCIGVSAVVGGTGGILCSYSGSHTYASAGTYTATLKRSAGLCENGPCPTTVLGTATVTVR